MPSLEIYKILFSTYDASQNRHIGHLVEGV
jgi:hypothetical protein